MPPVAACAVAAPAVTIGARLDAVNVVDVFTPVPPVLVWVVLDAFP